MKAFAPLALALTVLTAGARPVQAQPPSAEAEAAKTSEAQAHFHRGIEFYKQGDFAAAQVEFTRAYEMLSAEGWLGDQDPSRLKRLKTLGKVKAVRN